MDLERIIADLRSEKAGIDEAILALERIAAGGQKRRGRPPAWLANLKAGKTGRKQSRPDQTAPAKAAKSDSSRQDA